MTAKDAKQMVLAVHPHAKWHRRYGCISADSHTNENGYHRISGEEWWKEESAAWIDAASRLPAPKPIEPAQVDEGEGLPPLPDYVMSTVARLQGKNMVDLAEGELRKAREAQLKASLQRERELVELLREARMSFPMMQLIAENYGAREWSIKVDVALKAAVTGE